MASEWVGKGADQVRHTRIADVEPGVIAEDEAVQFTSELIRIDTSNRGSGDACERPAAEYVAERLAEAGIHAEILESAPGRGNVVARIEGIDSSRPGLLVHGHLDVVPAVASEWSCSSLLGRGARRSGLGTRRGGHEGYGRHDPRRGARLGARRPPA